MTSELLMRLAERTCPAGWGGIIAEFISKNDPILLCNWNSPTVRSPPPGNNKFNLSDLNDRRFTLMILLLFSSKCHLYTPRPGTVKIFFIQKREHRIYHGWFPRMYPLFYAFETHRPSIPLLYDAILVPFFLCRTLNLSPNKRLFSPTLSVSSQKATVPVGTRTSVSALPPPLRPLTAPTLTKSVPLPVMFPSVVVFWPALSSRPRWNAPLLSVVSTCTISKSTTVMRSATRTFLPIALLLLSEFRLATPSPLVSAAPCLRLSDSTCWRSNASAILLLPVSNSPSSKPHSVLSRH